MEAKEKAKELVHKFLPYADKKARPSALNSIIGQGSGIGAILANQSGITYNQKDLFKSAKECALLAVDEILDVLGDVGVYSFADPNVAIYWEEVKTEIKRLVV